MYKSASRFLKRCSLPQKTGPYPRRGRQKPKRVDEPMKSAVSGQIVLTAKARRLLEKHVSCAVCGRTVLRKDLERHIRKAHQTC